MKRSLTIKENAAVDKLRFPENVSVKVKEYLSYSTPKKRIQVWDALIWIALTGFLLYAGIKLIDASLHNIMVSKVLTNFIIFAIWVRLLISLAIYSLYKNITDYYEIIGLRFINNVLRKFSVYELILVIKYSVLIIGLIMAGWWFMLILIIISGVVTTQFNGLCKEALKEEIEKLDRSTRMISVEQYHALKQLRSLKKKEF